MDRAEGEPPENITTVQFQRLLKELVELEAERQRMQAAYGKILKRAARQRERAEEAAYVLAREKDTLQVIMENTGASVLYLDRDFNIIKANPACACMLGTTLSSLIGCSYFDIFSADDRKTLEYVRDSGQQVRFPNRELSLPRDHARATYWDWTLTPGKDESAAVRGLVLSLLETTWRKEAGASLKRAMESLESKVVERTAELTRANEQLRMEIVERKRAEEALRLVIEQLPASLVWTTNDKLVYTWHSGSPQNKHRLKSAGMVGKTVTEYFGTEDPEFPPVKAHRQALAGTPVSYERQAGDIIISVHLEPLRDARGKIAGVIGIAFDITENKREEEELRQLSRWLVNAQENEWRAIARELHDQISQSLALLKLLLDKAISTPAGRLNFSFSEAQELVIELIQQVRNLSLNLRPKILDDLGLLPTLLWHFERYTSQTGIDVRFTHSGLERDFVPEISTGAYRIIQESLSNVARHSQAKQVAVRVSTDAQYIHLEIKDDGIGFDPSQRKSPVSSGISGMRERVMLLGGSFQLSSSPGSGTTVTAKLPLQSEKPG